MKKLLTIDGRRLYRRYFKYVLNKPQPISEVSEKEVICSVLTGVGVAFFITYLIFY